MTANAAAAPGARHPWVWAVLYFPYGLTFGFPAIAIGFLGRRAGVPLSAIAGVVGMSFLAAGWKFLWAPLGDYTLSRKRWYVLSVVLLSIGLIALTTVPLSVHTLPLVSLLVRRRRVWVRLTPAGQAPGTVNVELGGLARTDNSGWGDEFEKLTERLVADLGEPAASRRSSQVDVT